MANLQDRQITIAGQTYTIRFSVRAMLALQDKWGLAKESDVEARMARAGMRDFVTILWAGLQTHHPELSEDQVLGWVDDGGVEGIEELQKAIEGSRPPARPPKGQGRRPSL